MELSAGRACIAVMARVPGAGAVKTRLSPRLGEGERAELYEAFLQDKLAQVARTVDVHAVVAVAPPEPLEAMTPWLLSGATAIAQRGSDLGARLAGVADDLFARGARAVLLLDSDTPTLPDAFLEEAVRALHGGEVDVVLGPASDGGYYLIGLRAPSPELFQGIAWSTPAVLRETLAAADAAGLRVHLLQSWFDVDTPADLDRLCGQLSSLSRWSAEYPTATARLLSALVQAKAEAPRNEHWKTRSRRGAYGNRWIDVTESVVILPAGHVTLYGIVRASPCVGVLPFVTPSRVLLVRQFRYVARRFAWEMPTGGVHGDESLEEAARRELREESGHDAATLQPLLSFHTSKSVVDEEAHLFVATLGAVAEDRPDDTEDFERRIFDLDEAVGMVRTGEIVDSMTVVALLAMGKSRESGSEPFRAAP